MRAVDSEKVLSVATSRWLPFDHCSGVIRRLPTSGTARVMVNGRSKFVPLALGLKVPFLFSALKWTDARQIVAVYFNRVDEVALSNSFPDESVLALDVDRVEPALPAPPCSVLIPSEAVQNGTIKWAEIFSVAPLYISDSWHPRFPVPVAAVPAVGDS